MTSGDDPAEPASQQGHMHLHPARFLDAPSQRCKPHSVPAGTLSDFKESSDPSPRKSLRDIWMADGLLKHISIIRSPGQCVNVPTGTVVL
jgi:hypothetical protein